MDQQVIGNEVEVNFTSLGNRSLMGKVDTGATTSSLHATNIKVAGNRVTFVCEQLSNNAITMELSGAQEVHSADGGGQQRPIVKFNIDIAGKAMSGVAFNLNDRSNMDDPVLIGQNILQAGGFIIDVNKEEQPDTNPIGETEDPVVVDFREPPEDLREALATILSYNIPLERFAELISHAKNAKKELND